MSATDPLPDTQRAFRDTIGHLATGVTIVTTLGASGPAGMTTNAVTSVSLDPMLLLVCFEQRSRTLEVVRESRRFAVNILRAADTELAAVFASKLVGPEKFEAVTHREAHGMPVLDSALAWIACSLLELQPAGDHAIGIGEVIEMDLARPDDDPLVFYGGAYTTIVR